MKKATHRAAQAADAQQLAVLRASLLRLSSPENAERPPSLLLRKLLEEHPAPGAALAQLMAQDSDDGVGKMAMVLLFVAAKDPGVPPAVSKKLLHDASAALLRALRDPAVPDERKYELGPLLAACGRGLPGEEYRACFKDFDAIASKKSRENIVAMSDSLEAIDSALGSMGIIDHGGGPPVRAEDLEAAFQMCARVAEENHSVGATVLPVFAAVALEQGVVPDLALAALDIAASTRHPRAAYFLAELARWPAGDRHAAKARLHAEELAKAGVVATPPITPTFSHGFITGTDGAGSRSVMLFFRRGDGTLDALSLLLNDLIGVKDVWPAFVDGADVEEGLRGLELPIASCDLPLARTLVADAFAKHVAIGRPLPGRLLLYRPFLGEEPIAPLARKPSLGAYLLETFVRGPGLVEASEELLDHPLYGDIWFCSDEAYAFVRAIPKKRGRRSAKAQAQLVDDFIRAVGSKERDLLCGRLATNLEVEALAGRAKKRVNQIAAQVWLAITENVVPFETIPYVRALAEHALDAIKKNIAMGYRNQREANEVGHAMEAEASEFLQGFLDGSASARPR